ncbi:Alpha/Beta hydrolase protein [Panaeolus papilionaceus]|nr:Alpha/Beta hydrolase protein [Panaeolus papilionaceus]
MFPTSKLVAALIGVAVLLSGPRLPGIAVADALETSDKGVGIDNKYQVGDEMLGLREPNVLFESTGDFESGQVKKPLKFSNPKAAKFLVNGSTIPDIPFDVGPSYAGLLPISGKINEERQLFFWFFPPGPTGSTDDLILWTNGGPGCSGLAGLLKENGPFTWGTGTAFPIVNPYSWTNLSSVIWIEQPVGTGFSQGKPTAKNEDDVAAQLVGFLQQFLLVFPEMKMKKFYLTGESFAGTYLSYTANYIHQHPGLLDLNLQGMWISDPSITWDVVHQQIPILKFVKKYESVFVLNQTFMNQIEKISSQCNYTGYTDKFLTYPPKGPLPLPGIPVSPSDDCDLWTMIYWAATRINPAFNIYRIFDTFPVLWDVLGFPGSQLDAPTGIYFNRTDVKQAIHAPLDVDWAECTGGIFPDGDTSLPPALTVLPSVIEKNNRTVIVHGLADYVFLYEGQALFLVTFEPMLTAFFFVFCRTRIAIQNMTWNGMQGFRKPIETDSFILDNVGAFGNMHQERGLTYYEIVLTGHSVPQFSPVASLQIMQYLMGFRDTP